MNQTPCAAYLTFEDEEAYNRALLMNKQVENGIYPQSFNYLLGERLYISEAPEPTDIIWENRCYTEEQRKKKEFIVGIVIFILLLISAAFIF